MSNREKINRVFLFVLDSFGVGAAPDAFKYGDECADTLRTIARSPKFRADTLRKMGLFNIDGLDADLAAMKVAAPRAAFCKLRELSAGKDTTTGHWELAGVVSKTPMPTFPEGFPKRIIDEFCQMTGRGVLCNRPYSGTKVIEDYGREHLETGALIVYTSADSVFQIAAHTDIVSLEMLYEYCRIARKILVGENAVSRVIARPFTGSPGQFKRTADRRDFSLEPSGSTLLDSLKAGGYDVISVGKISDIFAGRGVTRAVISHSNTEGMAAAERLLSERFSGLCFINLVDFDMLYGHRSDIDGYAAATAEFDRFLPGFMEKMSRDDLLIITADHGCDPGDTSTDHTREYIHVLIYGQNVKPQNLGVRDNFANVGKTVADIFGVSLDTDSKGFAKEIL